MKVKNFNEINLLNVTPIRPVTHVVFYMDEYETLHGRIGANTATFLPSTLSDVIPVRDAMVWAVNNGARTWEVISEQ